MAFVYWVVEPFTNEQAQEIYIFHVFHSLYILPAILTKKETQYNK